MDHEIMRLEKERTIINEAKWKAHYAYLAAQDQRTKMLVHFDNLQREKDDEAQFVQEARRQ